MTQTPAAWPQQEPPRPYCSRCAIPADVAQEFVHALAQEFVHALANRLRARAVVLRRQYQSDAATQFEKAADMIESEVGP